jgi:lysophospholipase L1-like esterase
MLIARFCLLGFALPCMAQQQMFDALMAWQPPAVSAVNTNGVQLLSDNFNRANGGPGANWTIYNSGNFTLVSSNLQCVGAGDNTHYMSYTAMPLQNENWQATWYQWTTTKSSSTYGIVAGVKGYQPFGANKSGWGAQVNTTTSSSGVCYLSYLSLDGTTWYTGPSSSALANAANDIYFCREWMDAGAMHLTVTNVTEGGSSITISTNMGYLTTSAATENYLGYFTIWAEGGTTMVSNLCVTNLTTVPADWVLIDASVGTGFSVSNVNQRFFSILQSNFPSLVMYDCSGGSDTTGSVLTNMAQILAYHAKNYLLNMGGNDLYFGVAADTWKTNYLQISANLMTNGARVVHLLGNARTTDLTPLTNFVRTTYPASNIVDCFSLTVTNAPGYTLKTNLDSGDHIHPDYNGHAVMANAVSNTPGILH